METGHFAARRSSTRPSDERCADVNAAAGAPLGPAGDPIYFADLFSLQYFKHLFPGGLRNQLHRAGVTVPRSLSRATGVQSGRHIQCNVNSVYYYYHIFLHGRKPRHRLFLLQRHGDGEPETRGTSTESSALEIDLLETINKSLSLYIYIYKMKWEKQFLFSFSAISE